MGRPAKRKSTDSHRSRSRTTTQPSPSQQRSASDQRETENGGESVRQTRAQARAINNLLEPGNGAANVNPRNPSIACSNSRENASSVTSREQPSTSRGINAAGNQGTRDNQTASTSRQNNQNRMQRSGQRSNAKVHSSNVGDAVIDAFVSQEERQDDQSNGESSADANQACESLTIGGGNGASNSAAGTSFHAFRGGNERRKSVSELFRGPSIQSYQEAGDDVERDQSVTGELNDDYFDNPRTSSQNQNVFNSICNPLGDDLPHSIKEKIRKGEFVDFGSLINQRADNTLPSNTSNMSLTVNSEGQITLNQSKPSRRITTIHAWTNAFLIYTAVYLRSHPNRAQDLLKYGHIVRTAASRFGGWGWRDYDEQFRRRQEVHPQNPWASIDGELWTLLVAVPSVTMNPWSSQGQARSFRGPKSKKGNTEGYQQNNKQATSQGKQKGGGFCYSFNNTGLCNRKNCRFTHTCSKCKKEGHGANICSSR